MPDKPQRDKAPNESEHGEDRERCNHFPRPLCREDRRKGGYVVSSVDDCDRRDLQNSGGRRLSLLSLPKAPQLSNSDDDGREAEQAHMLGRDR
jgi:hypothetical protein